MLDYLRYTDPGFVSASFHVHRLFWSSPLQGRQGLATQSLWIAGARSDAFLTIYCFSMCSSPFYAWGLKLFSPKAICISCSNTCSSDVLTFFQASSSRQSTTLEFFREPKTGSNKWCLRRIRAHQGTSRCINCVLLCRHAYTCIYIFGPAGPECGPASHRQEENRRSASRRITIHPRYHLFYTFFASSSFYEISTMKTLEKSARNGNGHAVLAQASWTQF